MKKYIWLILLLIASTSCVKDHDIIVVKSQNMQKVTRIEPADSISDGQMILGEQLANPYALEVMEEARLTLMEVTPGLVIPEISTSHYYVRFAPSSSDELNRLHLQDTSIVFYEYPLDREIISGVSYHDPTIVDSLPTFQYASIEAEKWENMCDTLSVAYTVLEELYIPEDDVVDDIEGGSDLETMSLSPIQPIGMSAIVAEALVDEAMKITGHYNEVIGVNLNDNNASVNSTNTTIWTPSGNISAYDDIVQDYVPIVGVRVRATRWFTTRKGVTDSNGDFVCDGTFRRPARYTVVWEGENTQNSKWNIRDGAICQAYYRGPKQREDWDLLIQDNGLKSLRFATIHRAAYRMLCGNTGGVSRPGWRKTQIAYLHKNHPKKSGDYWLELGMNIFPDIRVYGKYENGTCYTTDVIYNTVSHELGHSSHWYNASANMLLAYIVEGLKYSESWADCVGWYLTELEYTELGACSSLYQYVYMNEEYWMMPNYLNNQGWAINSTTDYTPLFIDILDDYNQYEYAQACNNATNSWIKPYDLSLIPNDEVDFITMSRLNTQVMNSYQFSDVKAKLLSFYSTLTYEGKDKIAKLQALFSYYE